MPDEARDHKSLTDSRPAAPHVRDVLSRFIDELRRADTTGLGDLDAIEQLRERAGDVFVSIAGTTRDEVDRRLLALQEQLVRISARHRLPDLSACARNLIGASDQARLYMMDSVPTN